MKFKNVLIIIIAFCGSIHKGLAQVPVDDSTSNIKAALKNDLVLYPEIKGYIGLVHPLYTFSSEGNTSNFDSYYLVGIPCGINLWKSKKVGISFEFTPFIRTDSKTSKVSNYLFHPGVLYRIGHDFTIIGRMAFETGGRYGFTPIINKVFKRYKTHNLFAAVLLPIRVGNDHPATLTMAFQFGIGF